MHSDNHTSSEEHETTIQTNVHSCDHDNGCWWYRSNLQQKKNEFAREKAALLLHYPAASNVNPDVSSCCEAVPQRRLVEQQTFAGGGELYAGLFLGVFFGRDAFFLLFLFLFFFFSFSDM